MSIIDKARQLRAVIEGLAVNLDDTAAIESPELFPYWKVGVQYAVGDRVRYEGVLYKVLQAHTSQAEWTPDVAVEDPIYESTIDNNVWSPEAYPQGRSLVEE